MLRDAWCFIVTIPARYRSHLKLTWAYYKNCYRIPDTWVLRKIKLFNFTTEMTYDGMSSQIKAGDAEVRKAPKLMLTN
jgi:hypothetical protein